MIIFLSYLKGIWEGRAMGKSRILAAVLAASLAFSSTLAYAGVVGVPPPIPGHTFGTGSTGWVWGIFGCSSGIILAAMVANFQQNRQLTANEAWTCGLLFWFNPPKNGIPGNPIR
jgi:hypothetical protein